MENPILLRSFLSDWCHKLDQKDIAEICDSEYRSPSNTEKGITSYKEHTECRPSSSRSSYVPSAPSGDTTTVLIHLAS